MTFSVFIANDGVRGVELWGSDGTAAGTRLIKDINPGAGASNPSGFVAYGGQQYFLANDGTGSALWRTNGANVGTVKVATGVAGAPVLWNNKLYFAAGDATSGTELWSTDGTTTTRISDINAGAGSSSPSLLTAASDALYFVASDGGEQKVWRTTAGAPTLVADITPAGYTAAYFGMVAVGSTVYFLGNDGASGGFLYKTTGSGATKISGDIVSGGNLTAVGARLYFTATTASGTELWTSDGSSSTQMDINPGAGSSTPSNLTALGSKLIFTAANGTNGTELWVANGSTATQVTDINAGAASSNPTSLVAFNGYVYFAATTAANGTELWRTDGTTAALVADLNPGSGSSSPAGLSVVNGHLEFRADDGSSGAEYWWSDGTAAGTRLVKDINATAGAGDPSGSLSPRSLTAAGSNLFFIGTAPATGAEIWATSGTAAGTHLAGDANAGAAGVAPNSLVASGSNLFFSGNDGQPKIYYATSTSVTAITGMRPLQAVSGLAVDSAGTGYALVVDNIGTADVYRLNGSSASLVKGDMVLASNIGAVGTTVYFGGFEQSSSSAGTELWKIEAGGGASLVKDIYPGGYDGGSNYRSSDPGNFTNVNGTLIFTANDGTNGQELWKSNGTNAGTVLVKDINPGSNSSSVANITAASGSNFYFTANNGSNGTELWKSDGSAGGTVMVKDINTSAAGASSSPSRLTMVGSTLFFTATDGVNGTELWKSDGTSNGTVLVKDIRSGSSASGAGNLTAFGGVLYFSANDGITGTELWRSDGTANGTYMLKDINTAASAGSSTGNFAVYGGALYFTANDGTNGSEIWRTDGTAAGTVRVTDVTGAVASNPGQFAGLANAPALAATSAGSASFVESGSGPSTPVVIDNGVTLSDPDSPNLTGAVVSITSGFAAGQDLLGFTPASGITGSYNTSTGVLTLSGTTTQANWQAVLRSVTFLNTSNYPSATARVVSFQLNDGTVLGDGGLRTVTVTPTNDPPLAAAATTGVAQHVTASGSVTVSDPENQALTLRVNLPAGGFVTVGAGGVDVAGTNGVLHLNPDRTYTYRSTVEGLVVGQVVTDDFTYGATDPGGLTTYAHLVFNVTGSATGDAAANQILGTPGADVLTGGAGNDTLSGGGGADVLYGNQDNDVLYGNLDADTLFGGQGNDVLYGGQGDDIVYGNTGDDVLYGNIGNDVLYGGVGTNRLDGGDGVDTASYADAAGGVTVSLLLAGAAQTTGVSSDTLLSIENLMGSAYADVFTGDAGANVLSGGLGNDVLSGGYGADVLYGNQDDDVLYGNQDNDVLFGGQGSDVLYGGQGDDLANGDAGDDVLFGNAGDDTLLGGVGVNILDGGDGVDTAGYADAASGVSVSLLLQGSMQNTGVSTDNLTSIENLTGSAYADMLTGDANANVLSGGYGKDILSGGVGADVLYGNQDDDVLYGNQDNDVLFGGQGNDVLYGGQGDDILQGGAGVDTLYGGQGFDLVVVQTPVNGQSYSTFADPSAGDRVQLLSAVETADAGAVRPKIVLSNTAAFQDYLDAATSSAIPAGSISAFDFGGNTYLVGQQGSGATFENGIDSVMQLVGIHTIGSISSGVVTLGS